MKSVKLPPAPTRSSRADERADAEPHRGQEHERLEEAEEHAPAPDPAIHEEVAPEDARRRGEERIRGSGDVAGGHRAHSMRIRPVRRRKTSSRVERRTRALSTGIARRWTSSSAPLTVIGVEQERGRAAARAFGQAARASVERCGVLVGEAQLEHLAGGVLVDELARRPLGDDLRLVHHHQAIAELLRLVHVVGRDDQRRAPLLQPVQAVPEEMARLGVKAGRRLVEDDQLGLVDERAGDRQPPLHAARERLDLVRWPARRAARTRAARRRAAGDGARDVEVAGVHLQVLARR